MTITLHVNGRDHTLEADPSTPLLYVLRDDLELNGAKYGCGLGQCGACTVQVDGRAVFSCLTPIAALEGRQIRTVEGLGTVDQPSRLQAAFLTEQAAQCGYCIAGMIMRAQALLRRPTSALIWTPICVAVAHTCGFFERSAERPVFLQRRVSDAL